MSTENLDVYNYGQTLKTGSIKSLGSATVGLQVQTVPATGAEIGDLVFASLALSDTGVVLGAMAANVTAPNVITVTFQAAPVNNDGVVNVMSVAAGPV